LKSYKHQIATKSVFLLSVVLFFISKPTNAQDTLSYNKPKELIIKSIKLKGNKKTKDYIILRELDFSINDTLLTQDSSSVFERNSNLIFNTNLFISVSIHSSVSLENELHIVINLKERWYIFPFPILELADRNFDEWWNQRGRDLSRLEWGIRFKHDNFLGKNEKLNIILQFGFTKKYEIFHELPYINKQKTLGLRYGISYSTNKSVGYQTSSDNTLTFLNSDDVLRKRFYSTLSLRLRPKYYIEHIGGLEFHNNTISDQILDSTNFYLGNNLNRHQYIRFFYSFNINKTDINYYPTKGFEFELNVRKDGLGIFKDINRGEINGFYAKYFPLSEKWNFGSRADYKSSYTRNLSYLLQEGLGYGEKFVRGYQPYVIDGQHFILNRNELKYRALKFTVKMGRLMPIEQFETVPYRVFIKGFGDFGYVSNNFSELQSDLSNRLTSGFGLGVDIVSYYDSVFRIEYAINNLKNKGLYLHLAKAL